MASLRLLGHIGLFIISIYVFCFASTLWGSNWTNWLWALVTIISLLFFSVFLVEDDGDYDIALKIMVCWIDSICISSITIKILAQIPEIHSIILLIVLLFIIEIGLNRMTLSNVFGWASLFMVWPYVNFHFWQEFVGFVVLCLLVVGLVLSSSFYQYNQEEEKNKYIRKVTSIANFVLVTIIASICLFFINYRCNIMKQLPTIGYIYLVYFILGLIIGVNNNIVALLCATAVGVCYFSFLSSWGISIEWGLHSLSSIWDWISSFFITIWNWIVWVIIHIWDGIVWVVSAIWWLFCKPWFWIAVLAFIVIILAILLVNKEKKDANSSRNIIHRPKPIIYKGRFMTCPYCRNTLVKGEPTNQTTRGTIKTATKATVGGVSVTGCATLGATIGSAIPGAGTIVGGLIGGGVGLLAGAWASYKINSKVDSGTEKVIDKISYLTDGVKLHFKCPNCGFEWDRVEKDGEIVH